MVLELTRVCYHCFKIFPNKRNAHRGKKIFCSKACYNANKLRGTL